MPPRPICRPHQSSRNLSLMCGGCVFYGAKRWATFSRGSRDGIRVEDRVAALCDGGEGTLIKSLRLMN